MPDLDKFDGTGDPKMYLRMYVGTLSSMGIQEELSSQLFQNTLNGASFC